MANPGNTLEPELQDFPTEEFKLEELPSMRSLTNISIISPSPIQFNKVGKYTPVFKFYILIPIQNA